MSTGAFNCSESSTILQYNNVLIYTTNSTKEKIAQYSRHSTQQGAENLEKVEIASKPSAKSNYWQKEDNKYLIFLSKFQDNINRLNFRNSNFNINTLLNITGIDLV